MQAYTMMDLVNRTMLGDETFYDSVEADARIAALESALKSCSVVLELELKDRTKFNLAAAEALTEARKALALMVT
jgi:hypothetical protein